VICHWHPGFCNFSVSVSDAHLILIGDSIAASLAENMLQQTTDLYSFSMATAPGCYPVKDPEPTVNSKFSFPPSCDPNYQKSRLDWISISSASIVVIAGNLPAHIFPKTDGEDALYRRDLESVKAGITDFIQEILDKGHQVVLVYPIPVPDRDIPKEIWLAAPKTPWGLSDYLVKNPQTTDQKDFLDVSRTSFDVLDNINHENLSRVYPHRLFCDAPYSGRCATHDSKNLFYTDKNHPSSTGAMMINNLILESVASIVADNK